MSDAAGERALLQRLAAGAVSGDVLAREAGLTRAAVWKRIDALRAAGIAIAAAPGRGYRLEQPLDLLQAGNWALAEQAFGNFVQTYPDDSRVPTASYWLGETYLFRKDYQTAASVFARSATGPTCSPARAFRGGCSERRACW
mgnify:CR=1 FL=1